MKAFTLWVQVIGKKIIYIVISLILATIVGYLLLVFAYILPTEPIRKNIEATISIEMGENDRYVWAPNIFSSSLDGFTDSLMLNMATYEGDEPSYILALDNIYLWDNMTGSSSNILMQYMIPNNYDNTFKNYYGRYWHGYLVYMKLILQKFTVADLRFMFMAMELTLLIVLFVLLSRKFEYIKMIPFIFAIIIVNPISSALCFQYADIFIITLVTAITLLLKKNVEDDYWKVFLWVGIAIAYFDLLTFPLLALGFNLVLLVILINEKTVFEILGKIVVASTFWSIGYLGMWMCKWVLQSVNNKNAFAEAINNILYRTGGETAGSQFATSDSIFNAVIANYSLMMTRPVKALSLLLLIILVLCLFSRKYTIKMKNNILPLLMISVYPVGWCMIVRQHSVIHAFFVHRIVAVTMLAIFVILYDSLEQSN